MRSGPKRRAISLVSALTAARIDPLTGNISVGSSPSAAEMLTMTPPPDERISGRASRDVLSTLMNNSSNPPSHASSVSVSRSPLAASPAVHQHVQPPPALLYAFTNREMS